MATTGNTDGRRYAMYTGGRRGGNQNDGLAQAMLRAGLVSSAAVRARYNYEAIIEEEEYTAKARSKVKDVLASRGWHNIQPGVRHLGIMDARQLIGQGDIEARFDLSDMDPEFGIKYYGMPGELYQTVVLEAMAETMGVSKRMAQSTLRIRYLALAKFRKGGWSCAGLLGTPGAEPTKSDWRLIVPVPVLVDYFGNETNKPVESMGYYELLNVGNDATRGSIKRAFYRLAKQWHPDVSQEPGTDERFALISDAYDVLKDPGKRQKYDAILAWKKHNEEGRNHSDYGVRERNYDDYQPPLRCGDVHMSYHMSGKWMIADEILRWDNIENVQGQTYVTSWTRAGLQEVWS